MSSYIPSSSGWGNQKYLPSSTGWKSWANYGYLRVKIDRAYDIVTNKSTLTLSLWVSSSHYSHDAWRTGAGGTIKVNGSTIQTFPANTGVFTVKTDGEVNPEFYRFKKDGSETSWTMTLPHDSNGKLTVTVAVDFYIMSPTSPSYVMRWQNSGSLNCDEQRQSVIAALPESAHTLDTVTLNVTRYNTAFRHKATITAGAATLWTSDAFETSLAFTPPRSWFDSFPNAAHLPLTVAVSTYTDQSCTTQVGSAAEGYMDLLPDAGMAPEIAAGFASAAPSNTGVVQGISGYVQGYSKAQITIDPTKATLKNNATVASYSVACQGDVKSGSGTSFTTEILTGSAAIPITVTVTDSRGLTASETLTIQPLLYAPPTITTVQLFRCDGLGQADDDGRYISVSAVGYCSPLPDGQNPQNTLTLTAQCKQGSGSYGASVQIPNGGASILGAGILDPDQKLTLQITATDTLTNAATATRILPTRKWAIKFHPQGDGVAFGKPLEYGSKHMELPSDWSILFGAESWLNKVYPVGSIYMSVNSTDPGTLFGGTWQRIKDRFLLSAGDDYAAGATGGEAEHTLIESEMPEHTHAIYYYNSSGDKSFGYNYQNKGKQSQQTTASGGIVSAGGGQPHNNMPPYLAVYVWQRTA